MRRMHRRKCDRLVKFWRSTSEVEYRAISRFPWTANRSAPTYHPQLFVPLNQHGVVPRPRRTPPRLGVLLRHVVCRGEVGGTQPMPLWIRLL